MHDQDSLRGRSTDAIPGGEWMTVAELAAMRGISKGSVTRLVQRRRWRQQPDNQGRVRVLVPHGAIESGEERLADQPSDGPHDRQADVSGALRKRLEAAEQRAERAEARARKAEQAQAATEAAAGIERERAAALIAQAKAALAAERKTRVAAEAAMREAAQVDRAVQIAMQAEAAQLRQLRQAEAARQALGRLGRLWAAWRGD
jgi:hypothetical protein